MNYYNEHDPFAAAWLRELMKDGHIPLGHVDERDIRDVLPGELDGYAQCHFFAGIGGWSHALRLAGWPDDRPVWTGSCPCQPFSAAGRGAGVADERHLWPAFFHLIDACRPPIVMGEQVASKDGLAWLDLVHADLEGAGYAVRAVDTCAAGVGAPHIRQRLWFVADADQGQRGRFADGQRRVGDGAQAGRQQSDRELERCGADGRPELELHHACFHGCELGGCVALGRCKMLSRELAERRSEGRRQVGADADGRGGRGEAQGLDERPLHGGDVELGDADDARLEGRSLPQRECASECAAGSAGCADVVGDADRTGSLPGSHSGVRGEQESARARHGELERSSGPWSDLEWLPCRDGKARPTRTAQSRFQSVADGLWPSMVDSSEAYLNPLAKGQTNRVGMLRGAGNAIVPQVAAEFIRAVIK